MSNQTAITTNRVTKTIVKQRNISMCVKENLLLFLLLCVYVLTNNNALGVTATIAPQQQQSSTLLSSKVTDEDGQKQATAVDLKGKLVFAHVVSF